MRFHLTRTVLECVWAFVFLVRFYLTRNILQPHKDSRRVKVCCPYEVNLIRTLVPNKAYLTRHHLTRQVRPPVCVCVCVCGLRRSVTVCLCVHVCECVC